jgi:methylmalonyl-CoA mutase, N-terminal domain
MTRRAPIGKGKSAERAATVPSPLVGEGQGGGDRRTVDVGDSPHPHPHPARGWGVVSPPNIETARARWREEFQKDVGAEPNPRNRSGIEVQPIYAPEDGADAARYMARLGFPGQLPMTRGIYPSMHRGRTWTQRQLIGLGVPEDYNARLKTILAHGGTAVSLIPCNSVYRGYDADEMPPEILGTCGVTVNSVEDMQTCLDGIPIGDISTALNDPSPFTLLALELAVAKRRGIPWTRISGTSNQSDYLSHFVANHMFFRLALPGARRVLTDHIAFALEQVPRWNPLSIVGQHMQQGGATPAEAMGLTLSSAIQYANDCLARGWDPDQFLPRFTFFFDISISFFEEVAKFRAGRRIWAELTRERFGARDPKSWRFKFHGQTSGVDLTRQQPLNNIARVTTQAMAGIFGGLQSLHTDAWDEVLSVPTEAAARIAVSTQNILKEEAHLTDVIDPLGGSYYVETLTDQMEEKIRAVIARIDAAGGMYQAVEAGLPQRICGESALAFQEKVEAGTETIVGVNKYKVPEAEEARREGLKPPPRKKIEAQIKRLKAFKAARSAREVGAALDRLARAAESSGQNVYAMVVDAACAGVTHGEICAALRRVYGFGQPLIVP